MEKRVRTLEYLRTLHSREDILWLNTIRLGRSDIAEYFGMDRSVADPTAKVAKAKKVVIRHVRTESTCSGSAASGAMGNSSFTNLEGGSGGASEAVSASADTVTTVPLRTIDGLQRTASAAWLDEYLPKYYTFGVALSELLLVPMSGPEFVDAVFQIFLEMDVHFASGTTARVLAGRALKNHRWARAQALQVSATDADKTDSGSSSIAAVVSAKPHFLNESLLRHAVISPSYDLVVPSLCTTIIFAYRRMCDFDAIEDTTTVQQIILVDKRIKRFFLGNITKELNQLAKMRTLQQAFVLTDHLFGAFSQADDGLVAGLLRGSRSHEEGTSSPSTETRSSAAPNARLSVGEWGAAADAGASRAHYVDPDSALYSDDDFV